MMGKIIESSMIQRKKLNDLIESQTKILIYFRDLGLSSCRLVAHSGDEYFGDFEEFAGNDGYITEGIISVISDEICINDFVLSISKEDYENYYKDNFALIIWKGIDSVKIVSSTDVDELYEYLISHYFNNDNNINNICDVKKYFDSVSDGEIQPDGNLNMSIIRFCNDLNIYYDLEVEPYSYWNDLETLEFSWDHSHPDHGVNILRSNLSVIRHEDDNISSLKDIIASEYLDKIKNGYSKLIVSYNDRSIDVESVGKTVDEALENFKKYISEEWDFDSDDEKKNFIETKNLINWIKNSKVDGDSGHSYAIIDINECQFFNEGNVLEIK